MDFPCRQPLGAALSGVFDPLVLLQGAESVNLDGGVVDEHVGRAVVWGDETIALVRVEPLHGALRHVLLLPRRFREHGRESRVAATTAHADHPVTGGRSGIAAPAGRTSPALTTYTNFGQPEPFNH